MKRRISILCCIIILIAILTSCVKDIILDAKEKPMLVVSYIMTNEPLQKMNLSYTKGASEEVAPRVVDATVVLTDLTEGNEVGFFSETSEGEWQLEYAATPGHRYRLDITVPGSEKVWAEQTMPESPVVECVLFDPWQPTYNPLPEFEGHFVQGLVYYANFQTAIIVRMERYNAETGKFEQVKKICTNYPGVSDENLTGELRPWMEFPGVPGMHLQSSHWDWYISQYPLHNNFLFLPLSSSPSPVYFLIDDNKLYWNVDDTQQYWNRKIDGRPFENVIFSALSDDYYHYLRDAYHQYKGQTDGNLSVVYLRDNLYTNIQGGVGIFGAVSSSSCGWMPTRILYGNSE